MIAVSAAYFTQQDQWEGMSLDSHSSIRLVHAVTRGMHRSEHSLAVGYEIYGSTRGVGSQSFLHTQTTSYSPPGEIKREVLW